MGKVRSWVDENSDIFRIIKSEGRWIIVFANEGAISTPSSPSAPDGCVGVEDWIFFSCNEVVADLIDRTRSVLNYILVKMLAKEATLSPEEVRILDVLADAFADADRVPGT